MKLAQSFSAAPFRNPLGAASHALLACSLLLGAPAAVAGEKGHDHSHKEGHGHGHEHGKHEHAADTVKAPALPTAEALLELRKHVGGMEEQLAAGSSGGLHTHDDGIQAAVRGLDQDAALTPEKKKRVQGYVKNVKKLAHKIHHAGEDGKWDAAKKEFAKLKAQMDLLEKQFAAAPKAPASP